MAARKHTFLQIGRDKYRLKEDKPISIGRYKKLKQHSQAHTFIFKPTGGMWWWYVRNTSSDLLSITQKEQNELQKLSYTKWLNKNKF